jgi:hypothetical protein
MVNDYVKFVGQRAFRAGYAAFTARAIRHAPAEFGTYCGNWVEGYDAAQLAQTLAEHLPLAA